MPIYEYKGLSSTGQAKTGILDADSPREARTKLRRDSIHVTEIQAIDGDQNKTSVTLRQIKIKMPNRKESVATLSTFTRQFATLLRAGTPLADALQVLIEQAGTRRFETILRDIRERVTGGEGVAEAMSNHPGAFNELYVNMVRAGEASGHLDEVLERIGAYLQRQNQLRNKVLSALMYPIIMVCVGTLVVFVLMQFVVPRILKLVTAKGGNLPLPTIILKNASDFIGNYWLLLFLLVAGVFVVYGAIRRRERGRYMLDRIKLTLPITGDLFRKQAISRFAVTFATLLRSGVPVLEALGIVKTVVDNAVMSEIVGVIRDRIIEGTDISTPLKKSKMFPPVVGHMISVGEQSGQLEVILGQLADAYDDEIDVTTQRMTAVLEPIMILCIAGVVAFIVLAIVLPMLRLGRFA
jgi:general secretion pathway protein F